MSDPNFPAGLDIHPFIPENERANDVFSINAQEKAIARYGIAGRIWEAAQLMTSYLELSLSDANRLDPPYSIFSRNEPGFDSGADSGERTPIVVVELGSGTGYVGIKLAQLLSRRTSNRSSSRVVLTDLPEVCPLLEDNLNGERAVWPNPEAVHVDVLPLPWGDVGAASALSGSLGCKGEGTNDEYLTHIVCSDLIYFPHLLAPLLRSLLQLTSPPLGTREHAAEILMSYRVRSLSKETSFWAAFGLWFSFSPVLFRGEDRAELQAQGEEWQNLTENCSWRIFQSDAGEGFIFNAHRKPESYGWRIPDDDKDLLDGIGALGTDSSKMDDSFETMLLMHMISD